MTFDPEAFKHMEFDSELDTTIVPPDEGVYEARIDSWDIANGKTQEGRDWARLDVTYELEDSDGSQQEKTGREKITAKQGIFLDLTDGGTLDTSKGRNVRLGQLLQAVNLNGTRWSFGMLDGQSVKVLVGHRETENGTMAQVRKVASIDENVK